MPILKYITDKRTPYQKNIVDNATYNKYKQMKVSKELSIPANKDLSLVMNRYMFGNDNISIKFRLVRFYLNKITFGTYEDTELMAPIICMKFGATQFIEYYIECISLMPELFTMNKSHYIASKLINLAFTLITNDTTSSNTTRAYSSVLGYLQRDQLCMDMYGISKNMLNLQSIVITHDMNDEIIELVQQINYLLNNNLYVPVNIKCDPSTIENVNFNINDIVDTSNDTDIDSDLNSNSSDDEESPPLPDNSTYANTPITLSNPFPVAPCSANYAEYTENISTSTFNPSNPFNILKSPVQTEKKEYYDHDYKVRVEDIATFDISEYNQLQLKPILDLIPIIRKEAGYMVPIEQKYFKNVNDDIFKSLPKPLNDLIRKHPQTLIIAGGFVANSITGVESAASDVDVFILQTNEVDTERIKKDILSCLRQLHVAYGAKAIMRHSVATICSKFIHPIQFIQTNYKTASELTCHFDLTCAIAYMAGGIAHSCNDVSTRKICYTKYAYTNKSSLQLRTLKYLAKGFKLDGKWEDHRENIEKLSLLCQHKPDELIKAISKTYNTIKQTSEYEIKTSMTNIFGGEYIGNQFEKIDLKPFVRFNCRYTSEFEKLLDIDFEDNLFPKGSYDKNLLHTSPDVLKINFATTKENNETKILLKSSQQHCSVYSVINNSYYIPIKFNSSQVFYNEIDTNRYQLSLKITDTNIIHKFLEMDKYFETLFERDGYKIAGKSKNKLQYNPILKQHNVKMLDSVKMLDYYLNFIIKPDTKIVIDEIDEIDEADTSGETQVMELSYDNIKKCDTLKLDLHFPLLYMIQGSVVSYGLCRRIQNNYITANLKPKTAELKLVDIDSDSDDE